MGRYGRHCEQCYRQNFGRLRSKSLNWLRFNAALALRYFGTGGRKAIAIDPSYISKAGKKTPHIGRFWSGCAGTVKQGLEIMGLGLIDIDAHNCMMLAGKHKLFFSTDTSLTGEEVQDFYRTRLQIEFCFRDAKQYCGLTHSQARDANKLDCAFNASFASLNVAKVMMKERGMEYSMSKFKLLMTNTFLAKRIIDVTRFRPNQTLINHLFNELFGGAA